MGSASAWADEAGGLGFRQSAWVYRTATGQDDNAEMVEALLRKRVVVAEWPEGGTRDAILRAIDDLIVEIETAELADDGRPLP